MLPWALKCSYPFYRFGAWWVGKGAFISVCFDAPTRSKIPGA